MNNIRRLAFIGGGNMAAALIGGLTKRGLPNERVARFLEGVNGPFYSTPVVSRPQCRECHRRQPSLIPAYQSSDRQLSEFRIRDAFPLT